MPQPDVHMSDIPEPDATESKSNNTSCVSSTVSQNKGKRSRASAVSRTSAASGDIRSKVSHCNQAYIHSTHADRC